MIKELIIILLVISLGSSTVVINTTTNRTDFKNSVTNDISFYTHSFSITSSNASLSSSEKVLAGPIYGGQTRYAVSASVAGSLNQTIRLLFSRNIETIYLSLDKDQPNWSGDIFFSGCCSTVVDNLYVQLQIQQTHPVQQNETHFVVAYSIYKYQESTTSSTDRFSGSKNILGYPIPSRTYILGLMILLIGMIPIALVVMLLRNYLRRKRNTIR